MWGAQGNYIDESWFYVPGQNVVQSVDPMIGGGVVPSTTTHVDQALHASDTTRTDRPVGAAAFRHLTRPVQPQWQDPLGGDHV